MTLFHLFVRIQNPNRKNNFCLETIQSLRKCCLESAFVTNSTDSCYLIGHSLIISPFSVSLKVKNREQALFWRRGRLTSKGLFLYGFSSPIKVSIKFAENRCYALEEGNDLFGSQISIRRLALSIVCLILLRIQHFEQPRHPALSNNIASYFHSLYIFHTIFKAI